MATREDAGLLVRFFINREKNEAQSTITGREVLDEVECISIRVPGSRDELVTMVTDEHRTRFKDEYRAFKRDQDAPISGTPLDQWPAASTDFINEMRVYGIRTVEQLAGLSDGVAMINPGWTTMRSKAQVFLETAAESGKAAAVVAENETLKAELDEMKATIARLAANQSAPMAPDAPEPDLTEEELEALTAPAPSPAPRRASK
jgi:hypothetical protein